MGGEGAADMLGLLAFFRIGGGGVWSVRSGSNFFLVEYVRWLGGWIHHGARAFDIAELGRQKSWLVGPSIRVVLAEISQEA